MRADVIETITLARLSSYHFLAILQRLSRFIFFAMRSPARKQGGSSQSYVSILSLRANGVAANALPRRLG